MKIFSKGHNTYGYNAIHNLLGSDSESGYEDLYGPARSTNCNIVSKIITNKNPKSNKANTDNDA